MLQSKQAIARLGLTMNTSSRMVLCRATSSKSPELGSLTSSLTWGQRVGVSALVSVGMLLGGTRNADASRLRIEGSFRIT